MCQERTFCLFTQIRKPSLLRRCASSARSLSPSILRSNRMPSYIGSLVALSEDRQVELASAPSWVLEHDPQLGSAGQSIASGGVTAKAFGSPLMHSQSAVKSVVVESSQHQSMPGPPWRPSLPSPPINVSSPSPPMRWSSPGLPMSLSLPP